MRSRGARFYAMHKIAFLQALVLDSGNRLALLDKAFVFSSNASHSQIDGQLT